MIAKLTSPKVGMATCLALIAASAAFFYHNTSFLITVLLSVGSAFITDFILIKVRGIEPFFLSASLVSGLIIGLVIAPTLPWYFVVLVAFLAMAGKNFIRFQNRHIFNPAGFGLFLTSLIRPDIAWWGVSFQQPSRDLASIIFFLILLSPGAVSIIRMRRYRIVISFWAAYILLLFILKMPITLDPITLFFSFVMLPEPMTTPNYPIRQLIFGPFVAVISIISGSLILGLLTGNLIFYIVNYVLQLRVSSST